MNKTLALLSFFALLSLGCSEKPTGSTVVSPDAPSEPGEVAEPAKAGGSGDAEDAGVSLVLASLEEIQKAISEAGNPVVLDIWSTSCDPCMKEFPGLVTLHEEHGDSLTCLSVCVDFFGSKSRPPERFVEPAHKFLKSVNSTLTNYLSTTADVDVFDGLKVNSIPAVLIFRADGTLAKSYVDSGTSPFSYESDVIPFVKEMLGATDSP